MTRCWRTTTAKSKRRFEELDNKKDFDIKYNLFIPVVATIGTGDDNIVVAKSKSFVSMQGWDFDTIFCLVDCDFLIRKPPDPDNDVYDFREVPNPNNTTLWIHAYLFFSLFNFSPLSFELLFVCKCMLLL